MALTKVSSSLVSDNAITTGKLVDGGVHSADIADVAVTSAKIANNAILTQHIDDAQVTTDQLGADAVTAAKIADDAISEEHLDITVITSLTAVTAATGDLLMVADVSDSNNLKKIPVSSILAGTHTGGSSGTHTGPVNSTGAITLGASALTLNGSLGTWSVNSEGARMNFGRGSANYINAVHESGFLVFQTSNGETALTLTSSQQANFTGTVTVAQNILSTSGSPLVLSAADGGSNIELYANGTAFIDATTTSFRGTNGSGSGNISVGNLTTAGIISLPGSTNGVVTVQDSYSSGALANQGLLRSSGGNYWGYSTYQSGSANWKSAVSVASERTIYAMDEDTAYWSFAPAQTVAIGSDLTTQPVEKVRFDLENGRVGIGTDSPGWQLDVRRNDTGTTPSIGIRQIGSGDASLAFQTTTDPYGFTIGVDGSDADKFKIGTGAAGVSAATKLTIDTTGNLDVAGTITGDDGLSIQGGTGNAYLQVGSDTGSWTWKNYRSSHKLALEDSDGTGEVLNFDTSGNATFAGTITSADFFKATGQNAKFSAGGTHVLNIDVNRKIYPQTHNSTDLGHSDTLAFRNLRLVGAMTGGATISSGAITSSSYLQLGGGASDGTPQLRFFNNDSWRAWISAEGTSMRLDSDSGFRFTPNNGSGGTDEEVNIGSSGNVGIGTNSIIYPLTIGDYSDNDESLNFCSSADSTASIYFRDANGTEGSYIKGTGTPYGGDIKLGALWDDDEDKVNIRLRQKSAASTQQNVRFGIGETDPDTTLHVKGATLLQSNPDDCGLATYTPHFTNGESGELEFTFQLIGTLSANDTIVFTYEAVSWKSWWYEITMASTDGLYIGKIGGYNNNSGASNQVEVIGASIATIAATNSGQHVVVTTTVNGCTHPTFKIKFGCGGGEGHPKMARAKVVVNS
jgi:hypothetical protein